MVEEESKDIIVLGAIRQGIKKFEKIQKTTQIEPQELNSILEQLEKRGLIEIREKKGWLGRKVEIITTEKGEKEVDERVHELQTKWNQMSLLYNKGDKKGLKQYMDDNRFIFTNDDVFGVMDMMMFSMMFSMMGNGNVRLCATREYARRSSRRRNGWWRWWGFDDGEDSILMSDSRSYL